MSDSIKVLAFVMMVVGFFIFHTWIRTEALTTGYELGIIQKRIKSLDSQRHSLKIERSRQLSPDNLEKWAENFSQRGEPFQNPANDQIFYLKVKSENFNVSHSN